MKIRHRIMLTALCAAVLLSQGCLLFWVGAGAGTATALYVTGELRSTEHVALDRAWQATMDALTEMKMPIGEPHKDALTGRLTAVGADNKDIAIKLDTKGEHLTEIRIRVGVTGDRARSEQILNKIRSKY